jgi:N-acetylglucosamine-6-phosphate deacetylase
VHITGTIPGIGAARVEISGGTIRAVEAGEPASELWLTPGFVDIQLNGFAGTDFSDPDLEPEQAAAVLPEILRTGTTTFCPTLITNSPDALARNFRVLEAARRACPDFARAAPCYHLEGPYLAVEARGVHDARRMHAPDWDEFCRLQEAAGGRIGIVTVAPELDGAAEFIARAARAGVVAAIGHTVGKPEDMRRAADAGARLSTHLGNGCPNTIDRHFNPLWAQIADDRLSASLICDGFHLPADLVQVVLKAKGLERVILISDATHVAGLPPGPYQLAGVDIELLPSGKAIKADGACLAGAAVGMDRIVAGFMALAGATLEEALRAAVANPARLLGRAEICRAVEPGQPASLVSFRLEDGAVRVEAVYWGEAGSLAVAAG